MDPEFKFKFKFKLDPDDPLPFETAAARPRARHKRRSSILKPAREVSSTSRSSSAESLPDPEEGRGRGRRKPPLEEKGRRKPPLEEKGRRKLVSSDSEDKENTPVVQGKARKKVIESSDSEPESIFDTVRKLETPARKVQVRPGQIVISSDSEGKGRAGSDGEGFINLYSPKFYKQIPPPDPAALPPRPPPAAKPKAKAKGVRASKVPAPAPAPASAFKTPVRTKGLAVRGAVDTPTLTFLSSLTMDTPLHRCHPEALRYSHKTFGKTREELARRLHELYNREIFGSALPADMSIGWNVRLTKTAGLCYSRRERRNGVETRSARIELSTKVIDSADRLRDTLVHEMCHAASWVVSGYRDGHGPLWRRWAELAMERFPELPVIDRCHAYKIRTKYSYRCVNCGYTIGRHSKSLDTDRKVCGRGHCHGRFELVVNGKQVTASSATSASTAKPKAPNPFAAFVKENYKDYKEPGLKHGDVMKILSAKFSEAKIAK